MKTKKIPCALCGQAVEIRGFSLSTVDGEKCFCCEGCLSIFHLLHGDELLNARETRDNAFKNTKPQKQ